MGMMGQHGHCGVVEEHEARAAWVPGYMGACSTVGSMFIIIIFLLMAKKFGGEIELKVQMHCEGCANKVLNCLKGFEGIEEVETDMKGNRVIVKGQKADPFKILQRVKKKYSKNVQLIFPKIESNANDTQDLQIKQEPQINVVTLKTYIHCEGCANDIKGSIERMKGILNVKSDMKNSMVTVRGEFDPSKLVETVAKKLGKYVEIVRSETKEEEEEETIYHYPPQYSSQHICPTHLFSDENIFSCSLM